MKKRVALLLLVLLFPVCSVCAEDASFSGMVSDGENIEITVTAAEGVNIRAFVYTYVKSGAGHCLLEDVEMINIPSGESKKVTVTPPEEGYSKKLVVAEALTLKPLCNSYAYPYMVNVYAEPLGYRLTNVGTEIYDGKTYASNEYDITEFMQADETSEASILSLMLAAK